MFINNNLPDGLQQSTPRQLEYHHSTQYRFNFQQPRATSRDAAASALISQHCVILFQVQPPNARINRARQMKSTCDGLKIDDKHSIRAPVE
jgi:hypothetical protein